MIPFILLVAFPTMHSFLEAKSMALEYVRQVQAKLTEDDRKTYDQFSQTLKQFRRGIIHPSTAVCTIVKLFQNQYPNLLQDFKPFIPTNCSPADAAVPPSEDSDMKACVDFLSRVRTRFSGSGVYNKLLDYTSSCSRGESNVSEVCDRIVELFGKNQDLVAEFMSFLPESHTQERRKKRRIDYVDHDQEFSPQPPTKKRKPSPARKQQKITRSNEDIDFDMEDSLFEVDVQIGNLESTHENALELMRHLSGGSLSPADVLLDEHFTALNLGCIRKLYRKLFYSEENLGRAVLHLLKILVKKKEALEKRRVKIQDKWNKIRQSRRSNGILVSK